MKKYTLLCLFAIGLTASLQAQSLSFDEALSQMRSGNQKLKGIKKQTEAADYNRKSFRGLYLPQLSVNASYMHLADPLYLSFNDYKYNPQNEMYKKLKRNVHFLVGVERGKGNKKHG